jgi:hypothetical protein
VRTLLPRLNAGRTISNPARTPVDVAHLDGDDWLYDEDEDRDETRRGWLIDFRELET